MAIWRSSSSIKIAALCYEANGQVPVEHDPVEPVEQELGAAADLL